MCATRAASSANSISLIRTVWTLVFVLRWAKLNKLPSLSVQRKIPSSHQQNANCSCRRKRCRKVLEPARIPPHIPALHHSWKGTLSWKSQIMCSLLLLLTKHTSRAMLPCTGRVVQYALHPPPVFLFHPHLFGDGRSGEGVIICHQAVCNIHVPDNVQSLHMLKLGCDVCHEYIDAIVLEFSGLSMLMIAVPSRTWGLFYKGFSVS